MSGVPTIQINKDASSYYFQDPDDEAQEQMENQMPVAAKATFSNERCVLLMVNSEVIKLVQELNEAIGRYFTTAGIRDEAVITGLRDAVEWRALLPGQSVGQVGNPSLSNNQYYF